MKQRVLVTLLAACPLATELPAQTEPRGAGRGTPRPLAVGDPCPPLEVETFLKGEPIQEFEKGKVYVVEFWATWCAPCIQSMPHLSALQAAYEDRDVTIIGTNIREVRRSGPGWEDFFGEEALAMVESFVREQGDRMAYTVAYDGARRAMDKAWMAEDQGLPTSFIVDRKGKIAWIGHPMVLRMPLEEVVQGTWDYQTGPDRVRRADDAYIAALRRIASDGKPGLEAWDRAERDWPLLANDLIGEKFDALVAANLCDAASAAGEVLLARAVELRDARALNRLAWSIVNPEVTLATRDLHLARRAARAANELTKGEDPSVLDTLARVEFCRGHIDRAIELQSRAVGLAEGKLKSRLVSTLGDYDKAKQGQRTP